MRTPYAVFILITTLGCGIFESQEPAQYHARIVKIQLTVVQSVIEYHQARKSGERAAIDASLRNFQETAKKAVLDIERIAPMEGDEGLREAAKNLLSFYVELADDYLPQLEEGAKKEEKTDADYARLKEIGQLIQKKEVALDSSLAAANGRFAKRYGLDPREHPFQEQIDSR